jgi:hypothetical protein
MRSGPPVLNSCPEDDDQVGRAGRLRDGGRGERGGRAERCQSAESDMGGESDASECGVRHQGSFATHQPGPNDRARGGASLRDLRIAEIVQLDSQLADGKVQAYRAKVKVSFKYEGSG